jgi:hypothetical protein
MPASPPPLPSFAPSPVAAVEIVTTLGASVVAVRHLRAGTRERDRAGLVLVVTAGLALTVALVSFAVATAIAADNAARAAAWTAAKHPAWAFRPRLLPVSLDAVALGGLVIGIGAAAAAWARRRERAAHPATATVALGPGDPLRVAPSGDGFTVAVPAGATAAVERASAPRQIAVGFAEAQALAGPGDLRVAAGTRLRVAAGPTAVTVTAVEAPRRAAAATPVVESRTLAFLAGSAAFHLAIVGFLWTLPPGATAPSLSLGSDELIRVTATDTSREDPRLAPADGGDGASRDPATAIAMAVTGPSGGARPDVRDPDSLRTTPGDPGREGAVAAARRAGLNLSTLLHGETFAAATGRGDLVAGLGDLTGGPGGGYGGPLGPGGFGTGERGPGPGGDGPGWGSIASGRIGIPGMGRDPGYGIGVGGCAYHQRPCGGRPHRAAPPVVHIGKPTATDVDPAVIRRYVKRHIDKIAYCYESQLLARPHLAGTVLSQFRLHASGRVMTSSATGVDADVARCVAGVVANIQFPRLADDGVFEITYPFVMRPTGT